MYRYIISFALGSSCPSQPLIQVDTSFVQAQPNLQINLLQPLKDQVGFKLGYIEPAQVAILKIYETGKDPLNTHGEETFP